MHPPDHPRPLLRRPFDLLDGRWDFALDTSGWSAPRQVSFDREILVPFAPETPASGVEIPHVDRCWYRRGVDLEAPADGGRVLIHFGAVDRLATVYANGSAVAAHTGGYTPWTVDVTEHLGAGPLDLCVRVEDDAGDLEAPRGKQDWMEDPHAIWYPRTTGLWRSVWVERVGATHISELTLSGSARAMTVHARLRVEGPVPPGARVALRIVGPNNRVLVDDTAAVDGRHLERVYSVGDGGVDDRGALVWWPRRPTLLDVTVALTDGRGSVLDSVESYTALRDVEVAGGHVSVNGRPYPLRLVLDQGYWRDTGLTAPDGNALRRDIELTKDLGFNGVRKHQKVEDPRYLAWADRLGLLVWVEMPSAYRFSARAATALLHEWTDVVRAAAGHPSVMGWVPINESWGVPNVEHSDEQRKLVEAMAAVAAAIGGGRPVSANDGWETTGGSIVGIHDYDQDPDVLARRYGTAGAVDGLLAGRRPDGRLQDLDRRAAAGRAVVLSEFGGIALRTAGSTDSAWGYREVATADELLESYAGLWAAVHGCDPLAGACWTQLTDTYQEINGLLTMDRVPKVDPERLAAATRGRR